MNGITNPIIFYPSAVVMILFALYAIFSKNIFRSLLSAIVVFFLVGFFFYILGSEYNAIVQIAVYGIAVPVILGLSIMFTNHKQKKEITNRSNKLKNAIFLACGLFVISVFYIVMLSLLTHSDTFRIMDLNTNPNYAIKIFGQLIYKKYVFAFEILSLLLTIVVCGMALFKKDVK